MSLSLVEKYKLSPELEETMFNEYHYLLYIAGLVINYKPVVWVISIIQICFFVALTIAHTIILLITATKSTTFLELSQNLNFASLCIISLGLYLAGHTHRQSVVRVLEIMTEGFYDYGESFDNAEVTAWKKDFRKFKIVLGIGIPVYLCLIAAALALREYIDAIFGFNPPQAEYVGSIYQRTPAKVWYPFEITTIYTRLMLILLQMMQAAILATTLAVGDIMMLFLGQHVALQLRILCLAATKIDERARNMHEMKIEKFGRQMNLNECYGACIKQLVEHHLIIKEFYDTYSSIAKWPTAIAFTNGSIMIAMSIMIAISGDEDSPSTFITAHLLLIAEVMSM